MWTHERLKVKEWKGQPATYKQVKLNGHRFTVYKQPNGELVGFERETRPDLEMTIKRPKIVEYAWWRKLAEALPLYSSVDGELHVPDGTAGDASHAIAECSPDLAFTPFAVPWWGNESRADWTLDWTKHIVLTCGLEFAEYFPFVQGETHNSLCKRAIAMNIEGWVLKQFNYTGWFKVKPVKTVDAIVTGFKDGDGKYIGEVGALKVSIYVGGKLIEIARVSGMTDDVRSDIDEKKDLGRVVEVEYQYLGNGNRLVHPRFVRWRDDKPAAQCVYTWEDL